MVVFGTSSFGPKLNLLTRATILATSSGEARSVDSTLQRETSPVRFDGEPQQHLAAQGRILAQLPVVDPVERRLVPIEDDLDFLVGPARAPARRSAASPPPVSPATAALDPRKADPADAVRRCRCRPTSGPPSAEVSADPEIADAPPLAPLFASSRHQRALGPACPAACGAFFSGGLRCRAWPRGSPS